MSERLVPVDELVTVDDIAKRLKMGVNTVMNIVKGRDKRFKDRFPAPITGKGTRAVWLWTEVEAWYEQIEQKTIAAQRRARRVSNTYKQPQWCRGRRTA